MVEEPALVGAGPDDSVIGWLRSLPAEYQT
jgi:hypothetical protein